MRVRWFGEPWKAGICQQVELRIDTPSCLCLGCRDPIGEDDRGLAMAALPTMFDDPVSAEFTFRIDDTDATVSMVDGSRYVRTMVAYHLDCFVRKVTGDGLAEEGELGDD